MGPTNPYQLTTSAQVTAALGGVASFVQAKIGDHVDDLAEAYIARSPLMFMSTHDSSGRNDVSPKGDAPGFVKIVDETTLLIPERKGNNLADGIRNIVDTGRIGLCFVVPGQRETLRVNGAAMVCNDPDKLAMLSTEGKPALLCTTVTVDECFFHCGKAMIRSNTWKPETWDDGDAALMAKQFARGMSNDDTLNPSFLSAVSNAIEENYVEELY